jgi:LemA protein
MESGFIVAFSLLLLPLLVIAIMYNGLVNRRNQVRYAFSSIDVQLKKRFDLIPSVVETVKGYAAHESQLLESVVLARQQLTQHSTWSGEEMLSSHVAQLMARVEAYPQLKADGQFLFLQRSLSECEEQIAAARRVYNSSVMDYHNAIHMFPSSIIASLFSFREMPSFEVAVEERRNPSVRF